MEIQVLKLKKGDLINASLISYCQKKGIESAWISGIGSCRNIKLAYYNVDLKEYSEKEIAGIWELATLTGNIGKLDEKPATHLHAVFSDKEMQSIAGHLIEAEIAATCELLITPLNFSIIRKYDKEIGLNLIS